MGAMGHPAAYTPNLDRLAADGALFRNAYCSSPQCVPSRSSMWSGQHTHRCEGWNNGKGLAEVAPTFETHLKQSGYTNAIIGRTDYLTRSGHGLSGTVSAWTGPARIMLPEMAVPQAIVTDEPSTMDRGDLATVDRTVAWLKENPKTRPFFLLCGLLYPHPIQGPNLLTFRTTPAWLDKIDAGKVTVPRYEERLHPVMQYMATRKNTLGRFTPDQIVLMRRAYFGMIAATDAMVGRVLKAVDDAGLRDSTYIVFTSDHGEMALEHRQDLKNSMYEASARVPLIIAGPGIRKGAVIDDLVSLVDIYPTLAGMAGTAPPPGLDGQSLLPLLGGRGNRHRDFVFSQYHGNMTGTGIFMVRRGVWKYIAYAGDQPQLFNLKDDPDEMQNLAAFNPRIVERMDALLRSVCDYPAVDARVKRYDRESFLAWRKALTDDQYNSAMAQVYRGWTPERDREIQDWLNGAPKG